MQIDISQLNEYYTNNEVKILTDSGYESVIGTIEKEKEIIELHFDNNEILKVSIDHLFELQCGDWKLSKDLTYEDMIKTDRGITKVINKFNLGKDITYDLTVDTEKHQYYLNNISSHNTGKTYLAETIAKHLDIPLAIVNTTSLTAAGYIGEDVTSVIERLWRDAGEDVQKAEKGIIFLDEIDKNASSRGGTNNKDVSGKAVQQELLKILEGDKVKIYPEGSSKNRKSGQAIEIDTSNMLFIAGGAFVGLKDKPGVQMNALGNTQKELDSVPDTEMLVNYGMIYEFIGRFNNIVELDELDTKTLKRILTEPKDSIIKSYKNLFSTSKVNIDFTDSYINNVANKAILLKTGARSLSNILEKDLMDTMFNVGPACNITIDYKYNKVKVITTA